MSILKKSAIAATLAATALATATPAMARDYDRGNNTAAIAIGAGIIGLAVGAIVASSNNDDDRYDRRYQVRDGWYYRDGYYYNRSGNRYNRADWQRRYGHDRHDMRRGNYGDYYYRRGY